MDYIAYQREILEEAPTDERFEPRYHPIKNHDWDYEFVRFGEPKKGLDFDKLLEDRLKCVRQARRGWRAGFPHNIDQELLKAVAKFRASLDLYEELSHDRIFSKEELYERCLLEGPKFTEFIKKSRQTCLRAYTSETGTDIEEEYLHDGYKGYNSILHERYLIHWDDRASTDDVKYCFMPTKPVDTVTFERMFRELMDFAKVDREDFAVDLDMTKNLRSSVMWDPTRKKNPTMLMREFWQEEVDLDTPYYGRRTVVLTDPGSTRDTCVGDPATVAKVKLINQLCRAITEKLPYSANCPSATANARYKRVLKRKGFIHLDFKKFGLTFPRVLMNIALKVIGETANIDVEQLLINEFFIEIDGEVYETTRGTALGWLDCLNSLCVCAILHWLSTVDGLDFDFVTFNDDVEISTYERVDLTGRLEFLRAALLQELDEFDIPCSLSKTYGSKASIFLERYTFFDREYGLDMYKEQLTVEAFAKSLVTVWPWRAKMLFASAYLWTKSDYAQDRCVKTCPKEFAGLKEEANLPLYAGGWYMYVSQRIDLMLEYCSLCQVHFGAMLSNWQPPRYSTAVRTAAPQKKIRKAVIEQTLQANSSELARLVIGEPGELADINVEAFLGPEYLEQVIGMYSGTAENWQIRAIAYSRAKAKGERPEPEPD